MRNTEGYPLGYLTKREFFAALALQGLLASGGKISPNFPNLSIESFAQAASELSDLLIAALNKGGDD